MPDNQNTTTPPQENKPDPAKELETLKTQLAERDAEIAKFKAAKPLEHDLTDKARLQREADDKKAHETKALEQAITFNLKSQEFLKQNESLLPKDVADIFAQAEKENYSNAIEKDQAKKAGLVQSFFSVQTNVDLLTPALKTSLDEYLKLTKTGKQEKAQHIFDTVFEPTFEMLKRLKKAEALGKGLADGSSQDAYQKKMIELTRKHQFGEQKNA